MIESDAFTEAFSEVAAALTETYGIPEQTLGDQIRRVVESEPPDRSDRLEIFLWIWSIIQRNLKTGASLPEGWSRNDVYDLCNEVVRSLRSPRAMISDVASVTALPPCNVAGYADELRKPVRALIQDFQEAGIQGMQPCSPIEPQDKLILLRFLKSKLPLPARVIYDPGPSQ